MDQERRNNPDDLDPPDHRNIDELEGGQRVDVEAISPDGTLSLFSLFFRPRSFFAHLISRPRPILTVFACYLFGVAGVADRLETRMLQASLKGQDTYVWIARSWPIYWGFIVLVGVISAAFLYHLGGWWYRKRLNMCGVRKPELGLTRQVYVFASLVWVIPSLLYLLWETTEYATPLAAGQGDDYGLLVVFPFLYWSLVTSYKGATTCFAVRRGRALLWFTILPGALYTLVISAFVMAFITGYIVAKPNVDQPMTYTRETFSVQYPGNWILDRDDSDFEADSYLVIDPPFADCVVLVSIEEALSAQDMAKEWCDHLQKQNGITDFEPVVAWTDKDDPKLRLCFAGTTVIDGSPYVCQVYVRVEDERGYACWYLSAKSAVERLQPGIDLIRSSFSFR